MALPRPARHTTLGAAVRVVGDVFADQDLLLEGEIRGHVDLPDHALTVAPGARVTGAIFARAVTVAGHVTGEITARVRIQVLKDACVEGDITAPRLVVDEGAWLRGRVDTRRSEAAIRVAQYRLAKRRVGRVG